MDYKAFGNQRNPTCDKNFFDHKFQTLLKGMFEPLGIELIKGEKY